MSQFDIVYFKGNPNSGTSKQHEQINQTITSLINKYTYTIMDSEQNNISQLNIPKAKIYIGFSRGSRYLKKLNNKALKISIGGVSSTKVHLFKNSNDNILLGDVSEDSLKSHFIIEAQDKLQIQSLIDNFLINL
ncbi:hypothetical protein OAR97_01205 [Arcobacteraceae bacterium]|nr:hypothetical protein [Arcobacteraceae bacterium]